MTDLDTQPNQPENYRRSDEIRRRRRKRPPVHFEAGEQDAQLEELGRRLYPRFDFLLFSLLAGLAIGMALFLDSLPILVLSLALTPFLAPVLGVAFAAVTGSGRDFFRVLGSLVLGSLLAFSGSLLVGWISRSWYLTGDNLISSVNKFSWISMAVLLAGVVLTTIFTLRGEMGKASAFGLTLVFFIYLPLGVSAYGWGSSLDGLWPQGFYLFLLYLVWAVVTAIFTFSAFGLRPQNLSSFLLAAIMLVAGSGGLIFFNMTPAEVTPPAQKVSFISPTGKIQDTVVEILQQTTDNFEPTMENTGTATPIVPTNVLTKTRTPVPSLSPTKTVTTQPTSVFALISAEGNGAIVRLEPDLNAPSAITPLMDGTEVKVLPETVEKGKILWVRIRTIEGKEGWILQELLATLTPVPTP